MLAFTRLYFGVRVLIDYSRTYNWFINVIAEETGVDVTECNTYNQTFSSFTIECSLSPETRVHQDQTLFIFEIKNAHTEEVININNNN